MAASRVERSLVMRLGAGRTAVLAMAIAMVGWVAVEAAGVAVIARIPALQLIWSRYLVHLVFMAAFVIPRVGTGCLRTRHPFIQIGRSLLMLGMPAAWLAAADRLSLSTVMGIFWLTPIVAMVSALIFLRERVTVTQSAVAGVGYAATVAILRPAFPEDILGVLLVGAMLGCFAGYIVLTRWLRRESTETNLFYTALGVFVAMLVFIPSIWQPVPAELWPPIIAIGLLGYLVLHQLDRALHLAPVAFVAPVVFLQPLLEVMVRAGKDPGALILRQWVGFAMLLAVGFVVLRLARDVREEAV